MSAPNVGPTADAIEAMAAHLRNAAKELDAIAEATRRDNNFVRVGDAATCVTNAVANLRLDLLIVRPLREFKAN